MYGTNARNFAQTGARSPEKSICWRKKPSDASLSLSDAGFNNKTGLVIFLDLVLRVFNAVLVMILPLQIPVSSELKIRELRVAIVAIIIPCDGGNGKCLVGVQRCGISIKTVAHYMQ
jgi:hypothetical protein